MAPSTFDALAAAKDLEAAGIARKHSEAIAEGMRRAASADRDELATKGDIAVLKGGIAALRVEIRVIGAIVLAMAAKMFGIFNAVAVVLS